MSSTTAGPKRSTAPAGAIIPSCRSLCPSRRPRAAPLLTRRGRARARGAASRWSRRLREPAALAARHLLRAERKAPGGSSAGCSTRTTQQFHWLEQRLRRLRRLPRRAPLAQAQGDPQGARGGHRGGEIVAPDRRRAHRRALGRLLALLQDTGSRKWGRPISPAPSSPAIGERCATARAGARPRQDSRWPARSTSSARTRSTAATGAASRTTASAFRAVLLPGDRLRHRPQAAAGRGRRPGRAQDPRGYLPTTTYRSIRSPIRA